VREYALAIGNNLKDHVSELGKFGADNVILADEPSLALYHPDYYREIALEAIKKLNPSIILAAATLCISAFATSNIFTITAMAMVYLIGHLESIAREYWLQEHAAGWFARTFLAVVAFIFPDLQAFNISDEVIGGVPIPARLIVELLGLAVFYVVSYLLLAIAIFYQREL